MMNLGFQRKTDLAIRVMRCLGAPGVKTSGSTIAESIGTTTSFLPQVMAPLIEREWIASERGPGGGYSRTDASDELSLLDLLEATEGPSIDGRCVIRDEPCPGAEECEAHAVWADARRVLIDGLRRIPATRDQGENE